MDAYISINFIFICFIIVKNYRKVKRPETEVAENIRRFIYSENRFAPLFWVEQICYDLCVMDNTSEHYVHVPYPQQKFENHFGMVIYLQSVNMV